MFERTCAEIVAGEPGRKSEIILDPRRRAGLPACCLALHEERPQAFRCAVNRGGEAGRPAADHDRIVLRRPRRRLESNRICQIANRRLYEDRPVDEPHDGIGIRTARGEFGHAPDRGGILDHEVFMSHAVAREQGANAAALAVPAVADDEHPVGFARRRARSDRRDPIRHRFQDLRLEGRRDHGERLKVERIQTQDAAVGDGAQAGKRIGAQQDRRFAEEVTASTVGKHDLRGPDPFRHLHRTVEDDEEIGFITLVHEIFARQDVQIGRLGRDFRTRDLVERGKHRQVGEHFPGDHDSTKNAGPSLLVSSNHIALRRV